MSEMYSIGKFAKMIGVTTLTLKNWEKSGKLIPIVNKSNGYRKYTDEHLEILKRQEEEKKNRISNPRFKIIELD